MKKYLFGFVFLLTLHSVGQSCSSLWETATKTVQLKFKKLKVSYLVDSSVVRLQLEMGLNDEYLKKIGNEGLNVRFLFADGTDLLTRTEVTPKELSRNFIGSQYYYKMVYSIRITNNKDLKELSENIAVRVEIGSFNYSKKVKANVANQFKASSLCALNRFNKLNALHLLNKKKSAFEKKEKERRRRLALQNEIKEQQKKEEQERQEWVLQQKKRNIRVANREEALVLKTDSIDKMKAQGTICTPQEDKVDELYDYRIIQYPYHKIARKENYRSEELFSRGSALVVKFSRVSDVSFLSFKTGLDACTSDDASVIIKFTDNSILKLVHIDGVNCRGSAIIRCQLSTSQKIQLKSKTIKFIRVYLSEGYHNYPNIIWPTYFSELFSCK